MANVIAAVGQAVQNEILQLVLPAVSVIAEGLVILVAVVAAIWFLLWGFGFKVGLSETARNKLRAKAAARKAAFPFRIMKSNSKASSAGTIWADPAESVSSGLDTVTINADSDFFGSSDKVDISSDQYKSHVDSVSSSWGTLFSNRKSLDGIYNSKTVSDADKRSIYFHASRLCALKAKAIQDNLSDWQASYNDSMGSRSAKFVA